MGAQPFWVIAFTLVTGGCQLVGDIGERELACQSTPPVTSGPRARFANLAVDSSTVELCFDDGRRLPAVEDACPHGLGYAEVSASARAKPGAQHLRVVSTGADCEGSPLFEADVVLTDGGNTLAWIGGGAQPKTLLLLPESQPQPKRSLARAIHAATDLGRLDVGLADAAGLPATITTPVLFAGLEFGTIAPSPPSSGLEYGYIESVSAFNVNYGASSSGDTAAKFVSSISRESASDHAFTMYAIGGDGKPHQSLLCDEQRFSNDRTHCSTGAEVELAFEMFDAALAGLLVPYPNERKAALEQEVSQFDSDVLCLAELWPESTKAELALAAKPAYPYQYSVVYDATTPLTDATGLGGKPAPVPRSEPYCASAESKQKLEELLDCLRDNCAAPPTDDGLVQEFACPTTTCVSESQALAPHIECGICAIYMLGGETLAQVRESCTVLTEPYPFSGASGLLILSRFPLEEPSAFLAPGTLIRRDILHARVRHPTGSSAEVFCAHSPPIPAAAEFYTGVYGDGANGVEAWRNERKLFGEKLFQWVDATERAPRSVVMGVFGTSPAGDGFEAAEPEAYELLTQHFPLAAPPGFVSPCTLCSDNPLVLHPAFQDFVLLRGAATVLDARVTHTSATVDVVDPVEGALRVPLSGHYGFRSKIRFSP